MGAAEVVAILRANTSQFTAEMGKAEAQVARISKANGSNFEQMAAVGKVASMALVGGIVAVGVVAVDLGNKADDVKAQLNNAFKNAGTSTDAYKGQIASVDTQLTKYGYTNTETNAALARLVTVTGNAKVSLNDMGLAADIAKNRHIDLSSATDLLAKTMAGNVTAAKRMGIEIPPEILKIKDPMQKANDITAILEGRFKGSAAAAAGTFSGRMEAMKAQAENLGANLGQKLIPILEKMVTQVSQVVTWFEKHKVVAEALAVAVGTVLTAAIAAYIAKITLAAVENVVQFAKMTVSVVTWIAANLAGLVQLGVAWTVYTVRWLAENVAAFATFVAEHAAMAAAFVVQNLLMIASATAAFIAENAATLGIVAGIALLVGGIIYLATHWSQVWTDIKTWVAEGADWVRKHFYIIMAIPFVGWIIELAANWRMVWDMIKATIALAWSIIQPIFNFIKTLGIDVIQTAVSALQSVWNTAWSLISGAISGYWAIFGPIFGFIKTLGIDVIQTAVSALQSVWNGAWSAISGAVSTAWSVMQPVIATITGAVGDAQKAWDWLFGGGGQPAHNSVVGSGGATIDHSGKPKASGGSVTGLTPYLVGEQGPELFTPAASGSITPNNMLGGGGSQMAEAHVTVNVDGVELASAIQTVLLRYKRTGGTGTLGLA